MTVTNTAYATTVDMMLRYDQRTLGDLVSDTGDAVTILKLGSNDVLITALVDAAGRIESAAIAGAVYTLADLAALTGNAKALVKRINCDIAMALLIRRRPTAAVADGTQAMLQEAEEFLQQIRNGGRLFPNDRVADASLMKVDGPTAVTITNLNNITTRTRHYFPNVASRLPVGRG